MVVETLLPTEPTYPTAPPTRHRMMAVRPGRCIVLAAMLAAAGCGEPDAIRVEDEPALPQPAVPPIPADQKQFRTLAAMVPADGGRENDPHWWFFKLSGPTAVVSKYEADFNKLIDSVRSGSQEDPISWELPAGWHREAGGAMRFASLKAPGGDAEVSVSRAGGFISSNAQRWWIQLWGRERADDVTAANVNDFTHQRTVNGRIIITVDMAGPKDPNAKDPNGGGPMMMNPHGGM